MQVFDIEKQKKGSLLKQSNPFSWVFAEAARFELAEQLPVRQFSKLVVSATHPHLHLHLV